VWGDYARYIPKGLSEEPALIVAVHGSLGEGDTALETAVATARNWQWVADRHGAMVIAPAFDRPRYQGPAGGYRGTFGRDLMADQFVNFLVDRHREILPASKGRFFLFGHSAGGQFVSRYVVLHPERVRKAVISAPGTLAFPSPDIPWADGMAPIKRWLRWPGQPAASRFAFTPPKDGWREAVQRPILVVVGALDNPDTLPILHQPGRTRHERIRIWVDAMQAMAEREGVPSALRLKIIDDVAHHSRPMLPHAATFFFTTSP